MSTKVFYKIAHSFSITLIYLSSSPFSHLLVIVHPELHFQSSIHPFTHPSIQHSLSHYTMFLHFFFIIPSLIILLDFRPSTIYPCNHISLYLLTFIFTSFTSYTHIYTHIHHTLLHSHPSIIPLRTYPHIYPPTVQPPTHVFST